MVHSHVTQARTGKSCAFRMQGGEISHVYLLPDIHSVNEIFYGMISLYNRRKAMRWSTMKEKFLMDLIGCYREYFPENIPVECWKTAALIVFRFAIPDEELDHICKLLIETELGELESAVYQAYRFYISEPFRAALAYILLHQDLPLSEVRYGLTDARQQSRTRIRNTKRENSSLQSRCNELSGLTGICFYLVRKYRRAKIPTIFKAGWLHVIIRLF